MFKTIKIFLIIFGLVIFILPKQMIFAQTTEQCCDKKFEKDNCCKTEKTKPCHSENSKKDSDKNNCKDDCANCHSCASHFVFNYLSSEIFKSAKNTFAMKSVNFGYGISFYPSNFLNIWQPPKIA